MILINFASRSRASKFHACMENISECFTDYKVCVKVDRNDPTIKEYLSVAYPEADFRIGVSKSKIHAINRDLPAEFDILVNTSDDILWSKGAGEEIVKQMQADTFLHFPEPFADGQAKTLNVKPISVVSIMDNIYFNRFGYVYNDAYKSLWCDNEATEMARKLGRYKFVDKYIFEHLHPQTGKAETDAQYKNTERFYYVDKKTFEKRKHFFT